MEFTEQLRQILRRLRRTPMFTCVTLITLAAGVGANTAVFSVLEGVLLKPLPYPHSDKLVGVWHVAQAFHNVDLNMAPSNYFIYREQNHTFEDVGLYHGDSVSVTGLAEPEQVRALDVTDGVLPILGIPPMLGRGFDRADTSPGSPDVVILTYGYWKSKFAGNRSAVGRMITIDAKPRQIVGVMPENFHFLDWQDFGLILPLQFDRNKTTLGQFSFEGVARLKRGVTLADANADVGRMLPIVWGAFPAPPGFSLELFKQARVVANVRPLSQDVVGDVGKFLWVLMGSIGVVLLIACANVANLLLVRVEGRQQELAIRAALGAGRARLAGELLLESVVIGLLGSIVGLAVAWGALRLLAAMSPVGLPRLHEIRIDSVVLIFNLVVSLIASLLFGSIPVLKYAGTQMGTGLREAGRALSQSRERHRARNSLVVLQVSLAVVLLICSGLMIRTFRALIHVNAGFSDSAQVQTFRITVPEAEVADPEKTVHMQQAILRKLESIPGVSSVTFAQSVPMDGNQWSDPVYAHDRNYHEGELPIRRFKFVSPGFFRTMGIPLLAGRDFTWNDVYDKVPVSIVSENFAREYWHDPARALGQQIRVSSKDDWRQIIGVVGDVHDDGMNQDAPEITYWPTFMTHFEGNAVDIRRGLVYAIRTPRAGSESLMNEVRQAVWSIDRNLPVADVRVLDYFYNRSMARTSFTLVMLAIAGSMALLLGTIGLYGVIAYSVTQRTREIGIRIAVGAQRKELTGMFVRQGLLLAGAGVLCGIVVASAAMGLLRTLLFHVSPMDPLTYVFVSTGLIATCALASYIPSRAASTVNPVEALRAE
ncbi:MAG TPA: ABC transporter permease [Terriglobales bacterium]|nr:ABC transporter permease [Terriglobales bacterium]